MEPLVRTARESGPALAQECKPADPEVSQALTRLAVAATAAGYCGFWGMLGHPTPFFELVRVISIYLVYSAFHACWVVAKPDGPAFRRTIGMFGDHAACTAVLLIGGESALPAFVVYIWVCVGNGMRFGARSMYLATAFALVGFAVVVEYHGPGVMRSDVVTGVFVALVAIPLFVGRLSHQLEAAHELLKEQARALQFEATHDRLTGLANRTVFFDALERVIARCDRHGGECAVVYFDVDGFKGINDNHGHLVGDHFLRDMAEAVARRIRKGDLLCRLAGDEFVVLTEQAANDDAVLRIADAIQHAVRSIDRVDGYPVRASASVGIARYPSAAGHETANALAHRADLAMYRSKRSGPGRSTLHVHACGGGTPQESAPRDAASSNLPPAHA